MDQTMPDQVPPANHGEAKRDETHPSSRSEQPLPLRSVLPLSPTEKKVCALLLQRFTEQRIAEHLQRSPNTVHVHVRNIYRKLGVCSRKQLMEYPGILALITGNRTPNFGTGY